MPHTELTSRRRDGRGIATSPARARRQARAQREGRRHYGQDASRQRSLHPRQGCGASRHVAKLTTQLGSRFVGTFSSIGEHAPEADIDQALDLIDQLGATVLVGFGGGSPIDACKVMAFKHRERHADAPWLRHIALPTTLSAAECSIIGGFTNRDKVKVAVEHLEICPAVRRCSLAPC